MEPKDVTHDICRSYIHDQTQVVNPAIVSKVSGFLRSKNIAGLATCSRLFDWALHTIDDFKFLRQVEAFYKKNGLFAQREECRAEAEKSFIDSEANCRSTNSRLRDMVGNYRLIDDKYLHHIHKMKRYISNVLGDYESFQTGLPNLVRVTPGATSTSKRTESLPQLKMRMKIFSTRRSAKYLVKAYQEFGFAPPRFKVTHTNRIELVPKNWKTDRTIACEPEGNLPLQLAFDTYAKRRLRRFGIDLSDQSANQRAAKHASIHNDYVTVDFKSASDTISYNTIALLFPEEWFAFLTDVRSPGFRGVFGEGVYAKFSSMGNGTTFTLETLVFAAACFALTGNRDFLVYGDDVIIHKDFYDRFRELTRFLGFTVNEEKSFASGPFRESCGGDFFNGVDVTPVFIRNINSQKASLCHLVNTCRCLCLPGGKLEELLRLLIADEHLHRIPFNEDTMSGIWINPTVARRKKLVRRKCGIDKCKAYVAKQQARAFVDSRGYYLWFLMKNSQVLFSGPWALARTVRPTTTSSVPIFDHKYVRKWVTWHPPSGSMPDYLYWWSEL